MNYSGEARLFGIATGIGTVLLSVFYVAVLAVGLAALFSIGTVWLPALQSLSGFGWLIGAGVGGVLYILFCGSRS